MPAKKPGSGGDKKDGKNITAGQRLSPAEISQAEMEVNAKVMMAAAAAKKAGKLPAGIEAMIAEMTECKTDWEAILARFVDSYAKSDYSYRKFNRSMMQRGLIGPGLMSEELGEVLIVLDLSGSIGTDEQKEELGEVFGIIDRYDVSLTIASADTDIYMIGQWEKGDFPDPSQMVFRGGGGTSLNALVEWVGENNLRPRCCIYITDGFLDEFGEEPGFPLLVAVLPGGTTQYVPSWAEVVNVI